MQIYQTEIGKLAFLILAIAILKYKKLVNVAYLTSEERPFQEIFLVNFI